MRAQAKALDAWRASGRPIGPLHGLPVALKDIIDTKGIPTENGTAIDAGRVPDRDAAVVQRLKAAGAVILGKTVTTELAFLTPAGTRNPHDPARHARRLVVGVGRGRGGRDGAAGGRHPDRRGR